MQSPSNLRYEQAGGTAVSVSWDPVEGAEQYVLQARTDNALFQEHTLSAELDGSAGELHSLEIGRLYEVRAWAIDAEGNAGEYSRIMVYMASTLFLPAVDHLKFEETGADSIEISWGAASNADRYHLVLEQVEGEQAVILEDENATSPVSVSGLDRETFYRVSVTTIANDEYGNEATFVGWLAPEIPETINRRTSHRLYPGIVQGGLRSFYQAYVENMRALREADLYWRLIDTTSFARGPRLIGEQFTLEPYYWQASVRNEGILVERLNLASETAGYVPFEYDTDKRPVSVSLGFDQIGALMLAYEDEDQQGYLYWYNNADEAYERLALGKVITPVIGYTYSIRPTPVDWSENVVAYLDENTRELCYRLQSDRYQHEYCVSMGEGKPLEILGAGPNLYGGFTITVAQMFDEGGTRYERVLTQSVTAFDTPGDLYIGRSHFVDGFEVTPQRTGAITDVIAGVEGLDYDRALYTEHEFGREGVALGYPSVGAELQNIRFETIYRSMDFVFNGETDNTYPGVGLGSGHKEETTLGHPPTGDTVTLVSFVFEEKYFFHYISKDPEIHDVGEGGFEPLVPEKISMGFSEQPIELSLFQFEDKYSLLTQTYQEDTVNMGYDTTLTELNLLRFGET